MGRTPEMEATAAIDAGGDVLGDRRGCGRATQIGKGFSLPLKDLRATTNSNRAYNNNGLSFTWPIFDVQ